MPLLAGRAARSFRQASSPPADAPIPTTGRSAECEGGAREGVDLVKLFWHGPGGRLAWLVLLAVWLGSTLTLVGYQGDQPAALIPSK
jgi:hypothetical protein